jgi:hypothetical protein
MSVYAISAFLLASCPRRCLAVARYGLTSLTLLLLGIVSKLPLHSLYATFDSDVTNLLETNANLP